MDFIKQCLWIIVGLIIIVVVSDTFFDLPFKNFIDLFFNIITGKDYGG